MEREGRADFYDRIFGLAGAIRTGVKFTVQRENIGGHVDQQCIRFFGFDIDGMIVDNIAAFKRREQPFKIRTLEKSFKSKFDIFGREGVAAVKFDALAQVKAHGQIIDPLPFFGQTRFKAHVLSIAYEGIEYPV